MHYTTPSWSQNLPSGSRVHNSLPGPPSERIVKVRAVVLGQVVPGERLAAVLVDALEDLVARGVAQPREERGEFAGERRGGVLLENDLAQSAGRRDLWSQSEADGGSQGIQTHPSLVAHQSFCGCVNLAGLELCLLCQVCAQLGCRTGWKTISSAIPALP
jgi:hypothetical protein